MSNLNLKSNDEKEDDEYPEDRNDVVKTFPKIKSTELKEKEEV